LVGPARIAYGSVVAAGTVCRQDLEEENQLHIPAPPKADTRSYEAGTYRGIDRIVKNNLLYIGNIIALKAWYRNVRKTFMCRDMFDHACYEGGLRNLDLVLTERIKRLGGLAHNMEASIQTLEKHSNVPEKFMISQRVFHSTWARMEFELKQSDWNEDTEAKETFLTMIENTPVGSGYTESIQSLEPKTRQIGRVWLQSIIDEVAKLWVTP